MSAQTDMGHADDLSPGTVGATAQELADRGLAQALAAALWDAEPDLGSLPPLPSDVPTLMDDSDRSYSTPTPEELASAFDLPVDTVLARPKRAGRAEAAPAWATERLDELLRLQNRQQDHVEKLYAENRTLRGGELARALAPLLLGLTKLYDQMDALAGADGGSSCAGMLATQLLQVLENAAGVTSFAPEPGERFDTTRQRGVGVADTDDPSLDGRVSVTVRPGFLQHDETVVRVAEVEVLRFRAENVGSESGQATPEGSGRRERQL